MALKRENRDSGSTVRSQFMMVAYGFSVSIRRRCTDFSTAPCVAVSARWYDYNASMRVERHDLLSHLFAHEPFEELDEAVCKFVLEFLENLAALLHHLKCSVACQRTCCLGVLSYVRVLTWLDDEEEFLLEIEGGECAQFNVVRVVEITVFKSNHKPPRHIKLLLIDDDDGGGGWVCGGVSFRFCECLCACVHCVRRGLTLREAGWAFFRLTVLLEGRRDITGRSCLAKSFATVNASVKARPAAFLNAMIFRKVV